MRLNHPETNPASHPSLEKFSYTKLFTCAKMVGDHCFKAQEIKTLYAQSIFLCSCNSK